MFIFTPLKGLNAYVLKFAFCSFSVKQQSLALQSSLGQRKKWLLIKIDWTGLQWFMYYSVFIPEFYVQGLLGLDIKWSFLAAQLFYLYTKLYCYKYTFGGFLAIFFKIKNTFETTMKSTWYHSLLKAWDLVWLTAVGLLWVWLFLKLLVPSLRTLHV